MLYHGRPHTEYWREEKSICKKLERELECGSEPSGVFQGSQVFHGRFGGCSAVVRVAARPGFIDAAAGGVDFATGLYLILAVVMTARLSIERIHYRAAIEDEGQMVILGLDDRHGRDQSGWDRGGNGQGQDAERSRRMAAYLRLPALLYYCRGPSRMRCSRSITRMNTHDGPENDLTEGLEFPGKEPPDYWDFVYYSFVIGTACATADVNVTSKNMRKITTLHCVVAFFFNTTILARQSYRCRVLLSEAPIA